MVREYLKQLKSSEKCEVFLVYDSERGLLVEKRLVGDIAVYKLLRELEHPYLPKLYDVCYDGDKTVVLEEYIQGGSLAEIKVDEGQLTRWLLELCQVLRFLHRHGIIHRDIKPSNVLIGSDGHIRLIDFDAARIEKPGADTDTRWLGTRGYAPPEQYGFAQTDQRSDIYALGVTFRELLGDMAGKTRWKCILNRCTALEPKRRYRYVWQISSGVWWGRICRKILYPLAGLLMVAALTFSLWSYATDTDFKEAMDIVLSSRRDLVFESVDIAACRKTETTLGSFLGDLQVIYDMLNAAQPELCYISTGYCDENGNLLFGGFLYEYDIATGQRHIGKFQGLYTVTTVEELIYIPPEDCEDYAPAVLALYELDILATPSF